MKMKTNMKEERQIFKTGIIKLLNTRAFTYKSKIPNIIFFNKVFANFKFCMNIEGKVKEYSRVPDLCIVLRRTSDCLYLNMRNA